jgi:hypothetical protein
MPTSTLIPMFDPQGQVRMIPMDKVDEAKKSGGKVARKFRDPKGTERWIPAKLTNEAIKAGGRPVPIHIEEQPKLDGSPIGRFLSSAGSAIGGVVKGFDPRPTEEEKQQGLTSAYDYALRPAERLVQSHIEQGKQADREFRQAAPTSLHPTQQQREHRQKALAHGLATVIPGVGPWAANVGEQVGTQIGTGDYAGAAGTLAGNATVAVAPKIIGKATRGLMKTAERAREAATKTRPRETAELVKKTETENKSLSEKASKANEEQEAQRKIDLRKHFEKVKEIERANEKAKSPAERKAALTRGVEKLDTDFQSDLKKTADNVRKEASGKYDAVRSATQGQTVPSDQLASAVREAESKIQGSSENLKIFRDILSKHPEEEGEIEYQGAKIPKGHPLYDVLKEGIESPDSTFSNLQGYYTELGDKFSTGTLPGDVYQAMKSLHKNIGNLMQQMADRSGVGPQFSEARNFYRQYMQTFRDHNSPLYKAIKATERGKSIASLSGKDQTGIQALARYNPDLAQRANTIRGYQSEARSIPSKPKDLKSLPKLEPKPSPISPGVKKIGTEDIQQAKQEGMQQRADFIKKRGGQIAVTFGAYRMLENVIHGNLSALPEDFAGAVAGYGITQAIGMLLENKKIMEAFTKPTLRDLDEIPPDMRGDIKEIVEEAQRQGIKVDPTLKALVGATAAGAAQIKGPKQKELEGTAEYYRNNPR